MAPLRYGTLAILVALATQASADVPFQAYFQGTFTITFGTGPGGANELFFQGEGPVRHLGDSRIDGYSTLANEGAHCQTIVTDAVTITGANGDSVWLVNSGTECLDFLQEPGFAHSKGSGKSTIVGGTGRFSAARAGNNRWSVDARIERMTVEGTPPHPRADGTFDLWFSGRIDY